MEVTLEQLTEWMKLPEGSGIEFKEAKNNFNFDTLIKYIVAFANEGGAKIVLGVTNKIPRKVVGTCIFRNLEKIKSQVYNALHHVLRVDVCAVNHPDGRVLVFDVPSCPTGMPLRYKGKYLMRVGEEVVEMTTDRLKKIFSEEVRDFSAQVCTHATFSDLDHKAIRRFRSMWRRKSGNVALENPSEEQLLADAGLVTDKGVTNAALILMGTEGALGKHLADTEIIFEYRSSEGSLDNQDRKEYREGFFLVHDSLWKTVNLRNEVQHFQDGLFIWSISTFNETVIREAVLNAVSHRDYRMPGSVFVRQFPRKLEVTSPGGFPQGVTVDNILWKQVPRNRLIAETFQRCGLVERSGQGMDKMFHKCISESKPRPDFAGTDDCEVHLTLRGEVQDPEFLFFLERVAKEKLAFFVTDDLLVLDLIRNGEKITDRGLKKRLQILLDSGVIEPVSRGRGRRYIFSHRFYGFLKKKGEYTRRRGLDKNANKALLLKHIRLNRKTGSRFDEFRQVLHFSKDHQIRGLLQELRAGNQIYCVGKTKGARWYPVDGDQGDVSRKEPM